MKRIGLAALFFLTLAGAACGGSSDEPDAVPDPIDANIGPDANPNAPDAPLPDADIDAAIPDAN